MHKHKSVRKYIILTNDYKFMDRTSFDVSNIQDRVNARDKMSEKKVDLFDHYQFSPQAFESSLWR